MSMGSAGLMTPTAARRPGSPQLRGVTRGTAPSIPQELRSARTRWAPLQARIYDGLPLLWPTCGGRMKIISFITLASTVPPGWAA